MPVTGKTGVHSSSRGMCLRHDVDHHHYHYNFNYDDDCDDLDDDDDDYDDEYLDESPTCKTLCHCDTNVTPL